MVLVVLGARVVIPGCNNPGAGRKVGGSGNALDDVVEVVTGGINLVGLYMETGIMPPFDRGAARSRTWGARPEGVLVFKDGMGGNIGSTGSDPESPVIPSEPGKNPGLFNPNEALGMELLLR